MAKAEKLNEQPVSAKKRLRQRKSNLYESIRKQMEFYFSTANLQKDRFLKKIVQSDPEGYVDIDAFLNFNKIKALTTDIGIILKAVKESETLMVDEKGAKIRRKEKYVEPEDTDQRTVYVEFLPKDTTIEWLINHFSSLDKVLHVSLPKYKSTGDIKGFAFVEFETMEGAARACQQFSSLPENLKETKPGIFAKTIKSGKHMKKPGVGKADHHCHGDFNKTEEAEARNSSGSKSKKKKRNLSHEPSEEKVRKTEDVGNESETKRSNDTSEITPEKKTSSKKRRRSSECDATTPAKVLKLEDGKQVQRESGEPSVKTSECQNNPSPMKKKSKNRSKTKSNENVNTNMELDLSSSSEKKSKGTNLTGNKMHGRIGEVSTGLRVISKKEWLDYRQEYYQKHKQNLSDLKSKLKQVKEKQQKNEERRREQNKKEASDKNKSGNSDGIPETAGVPEAKNEDGLAFVPDVIVKVTLKSPVSKKFLKERMSESGKVAFLDMTEGELMGHARCVDAQSAEAILKTSKEECSYELLKNDEEKLYWDKVFNDREKRLSSKSKKKTRGRDRILAKADKCMKEIKEKGTRIIFDD